MNKYRLKKDLAFAKAGAEVRFFTDLENEIESVDISDDRIEITNMSSKRLLDEGWVEEVKEYKCAEPREWYEIEFDNSLEWIVAHNTYRYDTLKKAQEVLERIPCKDDMPYRIIKVREVSND